MPALRVTLQTLPTAHRPAFRQERHYRRVVALLVGNLFAFARHTVTQVLLALGLHDAEWTASYRLFSRSRLDEAILNRCLICTTLKRCLAHEAYMIIEDRRETATAHQSDVLREAPRSCWCWSGERRGRTGSGVPPAGGES
ncbi:MAG: hypothetical protein D6716_05090 [Chloroflexi bacterium]|nr:MAG: hypothetical protein D6716_05090 [Chloroflexota bacterium]